jgi:hypothetical protein
MAGSGSPGFRDSAVSGVIGARWREDISRWLRGDTEPRLRESSPDAFPFRFLNLSGNFSPWRVGRRRVYAPN